jgi:RND family efflux transporter MFP subunit
MKQRKNKLSTAWSAQILRAIIALFICRGSRMTLRGNLLAIAGAAVVLGGCGNGPAAKAVPQSDDPPRQVRVVAAAKARIARTVSATGTLAADDQIILGAKAVGRLKEINVDLGSRVRKGQTVARIDPNDYELRVRQAETALQQARVRLGLAPHGPNDHVDAQQTGVVRQAAAVLREAQLTHDRMVELAQRDLISRAELDAAVSQLAVAEARYQDSLEEVRNRQALAAQRRSELEIARQQLADTVIVSPIDGAVRQRQASVGEYLAAGAPVATLVRIDPLRLRLSIPEREAVSIVLGQQVRLTVEGDQNQYQGRVARLSPAISEDNRTLMVEAEIPNGELLLRPGAFAKADVIVEADQEIVTVPADAIVTFAGIEKVLTVADGKAVEKRVRTGRSVGEAVEVTEGVSAGDRVIMRPGNLVSGEPVILVN